MVNEKNPQTHSAIVTVGDELVLGERSNENAQWMSNQLKHHQRLPAVVLSLPDHIEIIAYWLKQLQNARCFPILVSGGIGGTHDDCTRAGIAKAVDVPLTRHPECWELLASRYGAEFNESRSNMTILPEGCQLIHNPLGAPGFHIKGIHAFPGFPEMLKAMLPPVLEKLAPPVSGKRMMEEEIRLRTREGDIADAVRQFSESHPDARLGIYAHSGKSWGEVSLRFRYPETNTRLHEEFIAFVEQLNCPRLSS